MECELQALQYEVSLNRVKEEIRHVLDSEMAKRDGHLTPQLMYEAVKRYETYVARNERLDGKGTNTSAGQQHSLPPLVGQMMRLITLKVPRRMRTVTPMRLNLLPRKTRVCTSPVSSRRLYWTILFCRSRWPAPCEFRR